VRVKIKKILLIYSWVPLLSIFLHNPLCWAQTTGEDYFNMYCAACHTIGEGRRVGPDLIDVNTRHNEEWLIGFIQSSQSLIKRGNPAALKVFNEFNGLVMPDTNLPESTIKMIVDFIATNNPVVTQNKDLVIDSDNNKNSVPAPKDINLGKELFQGTVRFSKHGAACNSCHDVKNDAVIGGGILAQELTTVFSRMGKEGVEAILGQAPFPVMQAAYNNHPITQQEISALVAFLQDADSKKDFQQPRDYGVGLLITGIAGGSIVFFLCGLLFRHRTNGSVNQAIYDRQIKTK
jgi:cytochrome c2|tara:strand:- start:227 stop:1099 length:873 start_codon:yes stop_codon:yes gene_type:complete